MADPPDLLGPKRTVLLGDRTSPAGDQWTGGRVPGDSHKNSRISKKEQALPGQYILITCKPAAHPPDTCAPNPPVSRTGLSTSDWARRTRASEGSSSAIVVSYAVRAGCAEPRAGPPGGGGDGLGLQKGPSVSSEQRPHLDT